MVFSALTNTPCIVLPSKDTKILGTYKWISDISYIHFIELEKMDMCLQLINQIITSNEGIEEYSWKEFCDTYYNRLSEKIRG